MLAAPCAELSPLGTGKLSFQQPQVLHRLSLELQPHLGSLSPAQVLRCARSFASLRWLSRPLAEAIAQVRPGDTGGPHLAAGEAGDAHLCGGLSPFPAGTGQSRVLSPLRAVVTWEQVAVRALPVPIPSGNRGSFPAAFGSIQTLQL